MKKLVAVLTVLVPLVVANGAQAQTHSLAGSCTVEGTDTLARPIGILPALGPIPLTARLEGSCTGKLDGKPVVGAPVVIFGDRGDVVPGASCTASLTLNTIGRFVLYPGTANEVTISARAIATIIAGATAGAFYGEEGGVALQYGHVVIGPNGADLVEQCLSGTLIEVTEVAHVRTITPIVG